MKTYKINHNLICRRRSLRISKKKNNRMKLAFIIEDIEKSLYSNSNEIMDLNKIKLYLQNISAIKANSTTKCDIQACEKQENRLLILMETYTVAMQMLQKDCIHNDLNSELSQNLAIENKPTTVNVNISEATANSTQDSQITFCAEYETNPIQSAKITNYNSQNTEAQLMSEAIQSENLLTIVQENSNLKNCVKRKKKVDHATRTEYFNCTPENPKATAFSKQLIYLKRDHSKSVEKVKEINEIRDISLDPKIISEQQTNIDNIEQNSEICLSNYAKNKLQNNTTNLETVKIGCETYNSSINNIKNDDAKPINNISIKNICKKDNIINNEPSVIVDNENIDLKTMKINTLINQKAVDDIDPIIDSIKSTANKVHSEASYQTNNLIVSEIIDNELNSESDNKSSLKPHIDNIFHLPCTVVESQIFNTETTISESIQNRFLEPQPASKHTGAIPKDVGDNYKFDKNKSMVENIANFRATFVRQILEVRQAYTSPATEKLYIFNRATEKEHLNRRSSLFQKWDEEIDDSVEMEEEKPEKDDPFKDLEPFLNAAVLDKEWSTDKLVTNLSDLSINDMMLQWNDNELGKLQDDMETIKKGSI